MMLRHHITGTVAPRIAARLHPKIVGRIPTRERLIFLTYDDGPDPAVTPALATLLAKRGCGATFFVLGEQAERHPTIVRAVAGLGHAVANHGHFHADPWRSSGEATEADIRRGAAALHSITGHAVAHHRPPYGHVRLRALRALEGRERLVLWDVLAPDYEPGARAEDVARYVISNVRPGSIVVLHDGVTSGRIAVDVTLRLLDELQPQGWRFHSLPPFLDE